ncbi:hypothetical protein AB4511_23800, partial [Vibrio sp. 10N.222.54.F6]
EPVPSTKPEVVVKEDLQPEAAKALFSGKVLVVEDSRVNQQVAKMMLKKLGFEVDIADNGEIGVEKFKANEYEMIFM